MKFGKGLMDWLRYITPDQNLSELDEITDNQVSGVRRWWRRADLTPTMPTAWYDPGTGKYVLGGPMPPARSNFTEVTTASQASLTLTCQDDEILEVTYASLGNATRAFTGSLTFTPLGQDAMIICQSPAAGPFTQGSITPVLGGVARAGSSVQANEPIMMFPGDTLILTNDNYQGADDTDHGFAGRRWALV